MDEKSLRQEVENKIQREFQSKLTQDEVVDTSAPLSSEYLQFKEENLAAHMSLYEKICQFFDQKMPISPDPKQAEKMQRDIDAIHLQVTPAGVMSASIFLPFTFIFLSGILIFLLFQNMIMVFLFVIAGLIMIFPLYQLPTFLAQNWRMKASNQMVLAVFYIVTYMRHTSNLERAIDFSSKHLAKPLSFDFKKIVWNVETEKFDNIFDSLENYLADWKDYNPEFVESMHVIMGSLYESSEQKRQDLLDKSLDLILEETYDKMLHYAHNLQSPITALHMLGIVLPILGLIILPLMVNFVGGVEWYYISVVYNVFLPVGIYFMGKRILSTRPSGYGGVEVDMDNPEVKRLAQPTFNLGGKEIPVSPMPILVVAIILGLFLSMSPVILDLVGFPDFALPGISEEQASSPCGGTLCFMGYYNSSNEEKIGEEVGPYGLGATLLSLALPLSIAVGLGLYYSLRSKKLMRMREETEKLEKEFTGALFQLGNRLGDGLPPEIAFEKVAVNMPDSRSGKFFKIVSNNIQRIGMSVQDAIFDPKVGALVYYPSSVIESSMNILTQSAAKGPSVAANAISNVARYIREMGRVNERLQDLMGEVISSMKSQIGFLTPIISGIVLGITSMISSILLQLRLTLDDALSGGEAGIGGGVGAITEMFGDGIPAYYFSLIVGIYVVQVVFILSVLVNGIQKGVDPVNEQFILGKNLFKAVGLYIGIAAIILVVFNILATSIMGTIA